MAEFKVIETQEAFDAIIKDRLERQSEKIANELKEKYADYDSLKESNEALKDSNVGLQAQIADFEAKASEFTNALSEKEKEIEELNAKVGKYESDSVKTRIANEYGIPIAFADRLRGEDEESIRQDAELFSKTIVNKGTPTKNPEPQGEEDGVLSAFMKMNPNIKL